MVPGSKLHVSQPHGVHSVILVEDQIKPGMRIYEIRDDSRVLAFTGEEMASLAAWWSLESVRSVAND